tara:strand:+ start:6855 stop:7385 length:531 start_codon:yes stop_codon:yes gene_type:complete
MRDFGTLKGLAGFIFGSTFGFIVGMLLMMTSMKAEAYDANGEAFCLAKNIYFEAGNQPLVGKVAVSHVVLNRVDSSLYPDTICDVVYQSRWRINWKGEEVPVRNKCQFSWFCDGKSDEPVDSKTWIESMLIARRVIEGEWSDVTEGATHYHADSVLPYWASSLNRTVTIDNHLFYK